MFLRMRNRNKALGPSSNNSLYKLEQISSAVIRHRGNIKNIIRNTEDAKKKFGIQSFICER